MREHLQRSILLRKSIWVTSYRASERYPSGDMPNQRSPATADGLDVSKHRLLAFRHTRDGTALHRTTPHRTAPHRSKLHRTAPDRTAPYHTAPYGIAPHCTAPHHITPHRTTLHRTAPHQTAANCTAPHRAKPRPVARNCALFHSYEHAFHSHERMHNLTRHGVAFT